MKIWKYILNIAVVAALIVALVACKKTTLPQEDNKPGEEQTDPPSGGDEPGGDEPGGDEPGGDEPGGDEPGGDEPGGDEPGGDPEPRTISVPKPVAAADGKTLKILAIGNSFSQDAAEQYLYELFKASGQETVIGNMYIGGCTIDTHLGKANNGAKDYEYRKVVSGTKTNTPGKGLLEGIKDEDWDVITVQQASGSSGIYSTYSHLNDLIDYVKTNATNKDVVIVFHQTWAYSVNSTHAEYPKYNSNQMTMYEMICDAATQMFRDCPSVAGIIPSGTAIQNGRTSYLGDSFNRDGYHLEVNYGRFTAACTWFEALSGKEVTTNTYKPSTVSGSQAKVAKAAAHAACLKVVEVTELTDYKTAPTSDSLSLPSAEETDMGII